jgi:poly-gamma-glutamate synthesis protein (capsule biosynthesis protein)
MTGNIVLGSLNAAISGISATSEKAPAAYAAGLRAAGFDALNIASNRLLRSEPAAVADTAANLQKNSILPLGLYNQTITSKNIKVVLLSYLLPNEETKSAYQGSLRLLTDASMRTDFAAAKSAQADVIVVYLHGDQDSEKAVSSEVRTWAQKLSDAGADVIVGTFVDSMQQMTYLTPASGGGRKTLVAYSLGCFLAPNGNNGHDVGVIVNIRMTKNFATGALTFDSVTYVPTFVLRYSLSGTYYYEILPCGDYTKTRYGNMNSAAKALSKEGWSRVVKALGETAGKPVAYETLRPEAFS